LTEWQAPTDWQLHDSVEDFIAAVHGEPTNAELNAWGLYRADVERHYRTAVVVRVPRRELRRPFRWIRDWWRGGAIVALFLAILLVGGVR
jgi:hypothetical protein